MGTAWLKYLPCACTAEEVALKNIKRGVSARAAAERDNPFVQWIGADIRSDPWAYLAPGLPERAAEMAYRDARLSHRRNGIYGEMFFAAAQSAAFAVDDPVEALRIGLTGIPRGCALARDVRWALEKGRGIRGYADARAAVDERFKGMHWVHTINNACLTVFALMIGGADVTRVISEAVAMGMDNDCTAATAGSIVGAVVGRKGVPAHWHRRFNDTVRSYLVGRPRNSSPIRRDGTSATRIGGPFGPMGPVGRGAHPSRRCSLSAIVPAWCVLKKRCHSPTEREDGARFKLHRSSGRQTHPGNRRSAW